jgi:iron complex outermembrane receptor protein
MHASNIWAAGRTQRRLGLLSGLLLAGTLALLTPPPAAAAAAAAAPAATTEDTLTEIVVTAQRRTERLQDVPLAITALSGADLADRGVRQAADIAASVPNMLLNLPYGPEAQPTFTLRGVTTQDYSQNQSSPIAMYVDEVYKAVGAVQALQTYDLDRVEVLRGPQGTLYGKNATGGAISFYTRNPNLNDYEGYATLGVGNYGAYSLNAAAGGPLIDGQLGVRAALLYSKRDGWVHSVVPGVEPLNGVDALAGRLSFLYKAGENLTASLKLSVSRSGGTPYGAHALNVDPVATGFTGTIDWFDNGAKYAVHKNIRSDSAALKIEWLAGEHAALTSVTGFDFGRWYTKSDDGGLPITARLDDPNTYASSTNDFSEEIRLASRDSGAFGWLAGLYYGRESTDATVEYHFFDSYDLGYFAIPDGSPTGIPLYGFDEFNSFDQLKDSKAVFLNTTLKVSPAITLHAGARYTRDQVTISNFYALEGGPLAPGPTGYTPDGGVSTYWTQTIGALPATFTNYQTGTTPQGPLLNLSQSNNNASFRAGIDWKPSDAVLTYLNISQGYRGAAFNGQAFNFPEEANFANPEKLTSFEVGLKADLWNRRGTFNAALFHYDYRNQQFLDAFTLPGGSGSGFHTVNAPKSRVDGAEFELHAKAGEDFELRAALGLMHSKYVELSLHATSSSRNCCVGNKLIQAPDVNASFGVEWRFARLASGDLKFMVEGNYYGKQYFDAFNTERIAQGAYGIFNARLGYKSSARRGFDAAAWVKNLANQKYIAYGLNQNDPDTGAIGFDYGLVGEPRTYGLEATYRF